MEEILSILAEIQTFYPDDELTTLINQYISPEIDEDDLDMVYAAGKVSYRDFIQRLLS